MSIHGISLLKLLINVIFEVIVIGEGMHHSAMVHVYTVRPICKYAQNTVGAGPNPAHQRCSPLAHDAVETVHALLSEHPRRATEPRQPHQHSERIIVLHTQGAVLFLRMIYPQAACVKTRTVSLKKRCFYFFGAACKPAGYHVRSYRQRPPFPFNVNIILQVRGQEMSQVFKFVNSLNRCSI